MRKTAKIREKIVLGKEARKNKIKNKLFHNSEYKSNKDPAQSPCSTKWIFLGKSQSGKTFSMLKFMESGFINLKGQRVICVETMQKLNFPGISNHISFDIFQKNLPKLEHVTILWDDFQGADNEKCLILSQLLNFRCSKQSLDLIVLAQEFRHTGLSSLLNGFDYIVFPTGFHQNMTLFRKCLVNLKIPISLKNTELNLFAQRHGVFLINCHKSKLYPWFFQLSENTIHSTNFQFAPSKVLKIFDFLMSCRPKSINPQTFTFIHRPKMHALDFCLEISKSRISPAIRQLIKRLRMEKIYLPYKTLACATSE